MAVGATRGNVFSLIFQQGFKTVAVGLALWILRSTSFNAGFEELPGGAAIRSQLRLDRRRLGNINRRNRLLDSSAPRYQDGPDLCSAAGSSGPTVDGILFRACRHLRRHSVKKK